MSDDLILFDFYYAFLTLHALCKPVGCAMHSVVQYKRTIKMTIRGFGVFFLMSYTAIYYFMLYCVEIHSEVLSVLFMMKVTLAPLHQLHGLHFSQISAGPRITLSSTLNRSTELCLNCVMTNLSFGSFSFLELKKEKFYAIEQILIFSIKDLWNKYRNSQNLGVYLSMCSSSYLFKQ